jgi:hypothetical protein
MYSLTCLKDAFQSNPSNFKVFSFNGMFMTTIHGEWGMAGNEYYLNRQMISRKEIKAMLAGA